MREPLGKNLAFFEAEILLIEIAELFWFLRNERDMSQFSHG